MSSSGHNNNQQNKNNKESKFLSSRFLTDRFLVGTFAIFDLCLAFIAHRYIHSLNEIATRSIASSPRQFEQETLGILETEAKRGSWNSFERMRQEKMLSYLQSNLKPSQNNSLYFFPETLAPQSFEREFAMSELKPDIDALKDASHGQKKETTNAAYRRLKSRVENYELGTGDPAQLSEEAQKFLEIYQDLSKLTE